MSQPGGAPRARSKAKFRGSVSAVSQPLWSGDLEKKSSGFMKKWQKRTFDITGHYLKYSASAGQAHDLEVRSAYDLNQLASVTVNGKEISLNFHDGETLLLRAEGDTVAKEVASVVNDFLPSKDPLERKKSALGALSFAKSKASGQKKSSTAFREGSASDAPSKEAEAQTSKLSTHKKFKCVLSYKTDDEKRDKLISRVCDLLEKRFGHSVKWELRDMKPAAAFENQVGTIPQLMHACETVLIILAFPK